MHWLFYVGLFVIFMLFVNGYLDNNLVSECCNSPVNHTSRYEMTTGDEKMLNHYYTCTECGKQCNTHWK